MCWGWNIIWFVSHGYKHHYFLTEWSICDSNCSAQFQWLGFCFKNWGVQEHLQNSQYLTSDERAIGYFSTMGFWHIQTWGTVHEKVWLNCVWGIERLQNQFCMYVSQVNVGSTLCLHGAVFMHTSVYLSLCMFSGHSCTWEWIWWVILMFVHHWDVMRLSCTIGLWSLRWTTMPRIHITLQHMQLMSCRPLLAFWKGNTWSRFLIHLMRLHVL